VCCIVLRHGTRIYVALCCIVVQCVLHCVASWNAYICCVVLHVTHIYAYSGIIGMCICKVKRDLQKRPIYVKRELQKRPTHIRASKGCVFTLHLYGFLLQFSFYIHRSLLWVSFHFTNMSSVHMCMFGQHRDSYSLFIRRKKERREREREKEREREGERECVRGSFFLSFLLSFYLLFAGCCCIADTRCAILCRYQMCHIPQQ